VKESLNSHICKILQSESLTIPMRLSNHSHIIGIVDLIQLLSRTYALLVFRCILQEKGILLGGCLTVKN